VKKGKKERAKCHFKLQKLSLSKSSLALPAPSPRRSRPCNGLMLRDIFDRGGDRRRAPEAAWPKVRLDRETR
jgi:hypothetical protein